MCDWDAHFQNICDKNKVAYSLSFISSISTHYCPFQSCLELKKSAKPTMSQNPMIQKKSSGIDFTKTIRNDTYDFIKPEQFDLSSRSVLVTGASKGLGKDNAISFARAGASQIAIAARSGLEDVEKQMKEAAQKAGRKEPTILSLKLDVTDKQSVSDAAAKIKEDFGSLDIVINNAGYLEKWVGELI